MGIIGRANKIGIGKKYDFYGEDVDVGRWSLFVFDLEDKKCTF